MGLFVYVAKLLSIKSDQTEPTPPGYSRVAGFSSINLFRYDTKGVFKPFINTYLVENT